MLFRGISHVHTIRVNLIYLGKSGRAHPRRVFSGLKNSKDSLMGRVFEVSLGDLKTKVPILS